MVRTVHSPVDIALEAITVTFRMVVVHSDVNMATGTTGVIRVRFLPIAVIYRNGVFTFIQVL